MAKAGALVSPSMLPLVVSQFQQGCMTMTLLGTKYSSVIIINRQGAQARGICLQQVQVSECIKKTLEDTKLSIVFSDVSERPAMQELLIEFMVLAERWQLEVA